VLHFDGYQSFGLLLRLHINSLSVVVRATANQEEASKQQQQRPISPTAATPRKI